MSQTPKYCLAYEPTIHKSLFSVDFGKLFKGKSYWKFNTSNLILKDTEYMEELKEVIKFVKLIYITPNNGMNETNINEIPAQQLQFLISD